MNGSIGSARRADAERSRLAVIAAAKRLLSGGAKLDMSGVAASAGVSRSTLYRHFASADELRGELLELALADAEQVVAAATSLERAPLAQLRAVVVALCDIAAAYGAPGLGDLLDDDRLEPVAERLGPLVERIARLSGFNPVPPPDWTRVAIVHAVRACLVSGMSAERLLDQITGQLDGALVIVDPSGHLLGANDAAVAALALDQAEVGLGVIGPQTTVLYEDGSRCPNDTYPLARAILEGQSQEPVVRGHRFADGTTQWFSVAVHALRRRPEETPYGYLATLTDVTAERDAHLQRLHPAGTLAQREPPPLDVARVLDAVPAQVLPDQIVAEARRLVEVPVALYVVDIDGTHLLRLAGTDEFPDRIEARLALGPELAEEGLPELIERLGDELPGAVAAPMWLRGRAVGMLVAVRGSAELLSQVARQAALAMELANGYTDVFDAARRRKDINPAGEIQQSLLPPRIARFAGGQIAAGVLPSYDTGGDWFDYVDNRDGAWVAIADAAGRGVRAASLGSIALAALRAARRNDATLESAVATMHATVCEAESASFYLTAIVARWSAIHSSFSWICAGHPPPLLIQPDGAIVELVAPVQLPLGLGGPDRRFRRSFRRLSADERIVLYTDGVSARPVGDGLFGKDGIARAVRAAPTRSASAIAKSIQDHVADASERPLRDDAAVVVIAPGQSAD